jgi:hypothetical protein
VFGRLSAKRRIREVREHGVQTARALAGGDSSEHRRFQPASSPHRHACCHGVIHTSVLGSPTSFFSFHDSLQYSPGRVAYSRSAVRGPLDGNCGKCLPIRLLSPSYSRPLTVGERWVTTVRRVRGRRKRPHKPSSLWRDRPFLHSFSLAQSSRMDFRVASVPSPQLRANEVWWQPPDFRVVPLPLPTANATATRTLPTSNPV